MFNFGRSSNFGTLSKKGRLSSLWSMSTSVTASQELRSLRVAKLQEVLGQFHDVQVTFTSATLSKTPGLLDILTCVWKLPYRSLSLLCTLRRPLQVAQHQKKNTCICGIYELAGGSTCVQGAVPRQLPKTGLGPFGHGPATSHSRLSWVHGSAFTGCHSWFFEGKDMVWYWYVLSKGRW